MRLHVESVRLWRLSVTTPTCEGKMTPRKLKRLLPQASAAFLRLNGGAESEPSKPIKIAGMEDDLYALKEAMPALARARISTDEQGLNKTERAFYEALKRGLGPMPQPTPWLRVHSPHPVTLKLADDCRLNPDFVAVYQDQTWCVVDVKGWQREDAFLKMKMAARIFVEHTFWIVKRDATQPSGWNWRLVKP